MASLSGYRRFRGDGERAERGRAGVPRAVLDCAARRAQHLAKPKGDAEPGAVTSQTQGEAPQPRWAMTQNGFYGICARRSVSLPVENTMTTMRTSRAGDAMKPVTERLRGFLLVPSLIALLMTGELAAPR